MTSTMSLASSSKSASKDLKDEQPEPKTSAINDLKIPSHQINELFMTQHNFEPAVKVRLYVDGKFHHESIHPYCHLETFSKIKELIKSHGSSIMETFEVESVHIDTFTIQFTNRHRQKVSSVDANKPRRWVETGTEHSPETFNALMKATCARVSVGHDYCGCGDTKKCESAKRMPEVRLFLASLDANNTRTVTCDSDGSDDGVDGVDPAKVVEIAFHSAFIEPDEKTPAVEPKVMINASCLRRLIHNGDEKKLGRPGLASRLGVGPRKRQRVSVGTPSDEIAHQDNHAIHILDSGSEGGNIEYEDNNKNDLNKQDIVNVMVVDGEVIELN